MFYYCGTCEEEYHPMDLMANGHCVICLDKPVELD